jgi:trans-2,3-dihydro-3-hydroxyanthranilate isomerase
MRQFPFLQYDVFTDTPLAGNQLAVFADAVGLSDEEMQSIAREMNFSETTFVLPATDIKAIRRVRIFTPSTELPFAGHPTIGTTFALAHANILRSSEELPVYLQLGIGNLPVDLLYEGEQLSFVWMHQRLPEFGPWSGSPERLLASVGLSTDDLATDLPIECGSAGVPFLFVPLRSREALRRAEPGLGDLAGALGAQEPHIGVYFFSAAAEDMAVRSARMFAPGMGVSEDPATGSAAGPFGVYLLRHGQLRANQVGQDGQDGEARLQVEQGVDMGRPSRISVALACRSGEVQDVRVGGESVLVAEGSLILP